ncbi:MAG: isochorismatase family protein [Proteobacteria bacterium]|nr:isochorismatase family protein [Pseudomonadota bacterium]
MVTGIETHVCVPPRGLDLIHAGYWVEVVEDAVSFRRAGDRPTAIKLFRQAGAVVTVRRDRDLWMGMPFEH